MKTVINAVNQLKAEWAFNDSVSAYFRISGETGYWYFGESKPLLDEHVCTREEFNQCVDEMSKAEWIKPVTSPTFTQAMYDKDVLPSVGMEFYDTNYSTSKPVTSLFIDGDNVVYKNMINGSGRTYNSARLSSIKPLTPPIELIGGERCEFEIGFGNLHVGYYSVSRDSFFIDTFYSNKICGKSEAANIQLLEVK